MANQRFLWIGISCFILSLVISLVTWFRPSGPRIAYVRSYDLINKFAGTIEARSGFEKTKASMIANVDSMKMHIDNAALDYRTRAERFTKEERIAKEQELNLLQGQFLQYNEVIERKIEEEDQEMMGAVLNQVNSFIEKYAQDQGYQIILGTTLSGNLLYGEATMDITEDVVKAMNENYKGK